MMFVLSLSLSLFWWMIASRLLVTVTVYSGISLLCARVPAPG
jgi:hypothetical protein